MKQLINVQGSRNLSNQNHLEWEIDTNEDLSAYSLVIKKANSPEETFEVIDTLAIDTASWDDIKTDPRIEWMESYYKIGLSNGTSYEFPDLIKINPKGEPAVLEMERRMRLTLKQYNGIECYFLKKRHAGMRCTECYSPVTNQIKKSNCEVCYSTGFVGGYYTPIDGYVSMSSIDDVIRKQLFGNIDNTKTMMITANYCWLKPQDYVILTTDNKRYLILANEHSEMKGYKFPSQLLTVEEMPASDIIYKFPIS